jgi:hypothetical protein
MAETRALSAAHRTWFDDTRTPVRRMAVSTHADEGVVVVSHWHGSTCVSTFRFPLRDAGRLVAILADGMAEAVPVRDDDAPPPPVTRAGSRWRRILSRRRGDDGRTRLRSVE